MKRLIWLPIAGFLLIAGATAAGVAFEVAGAGSLLQDVLADLVTQGVITQEQSDAITAALTPRVDERRAEIEQQRAEMEALRTQIQGFLEDGVISADEIAQLPADNPFSNIESILEDGQVTLEELQSVGPFGGFPFDGRGPGGGHGHGFGPRGPGMWVAPDVEDSANDDANSSPDATSQNS